MTKKRILLIVNPKDAARRNYSIKQANVPNKSNAVLLNTGDV